MDWSGCGLADRDTHSRALASRRPQSISFVVPNSFTNETMRTRQLILPALLLVLASRPIRAQEPVLSAERRAAITEASRLVNAPADFVLRHRTELALSEQQVASLEKLAAALRDSSVARMARLTRDAQATGTSAGLMSAMEWSGPIDEAAIRERMRQQSLGQAEFMIAGARDRRAVGALLTPEQRAKLTPLQMAEMSKAMRDGAR
jgi:Spy/CpxP family protein refolding chaperone